MKSLEVKKEEAKKRQAIRDKRSTKDQLEHLDSIFGKGLGAKKEREKLLTLINKEKEVKEEQKDKNEKKSKKSK